MVDAFADTETDRTKSAWVARVYADFVKDTGRSRTTQRGLFHYAMQRKVADYPICGSFVGEIRVMRRYHESDGAKLAKWVRKAIGLGFIPEDAIIFDSPGGHVYLPDQPADLPCSIEVWIDRSTFDPLIRNVCSGYGAVLVSVDGKACEKAVIDLGGRYAGPTVIFCLCDLGSSFPSDLAAEIARSHLAKADIKLRRIGLLPRQVAELNIPNAACRSDSVDAGWNLAGYLKKTSHGLIKGAELDCLEVYYPGGLASFLDGYLRGFKCGLNPDREEPWLLNSSQGQII